ncbi:hypothetical protein DFR41_1217 [Pseudacidovorax intermedius]|uniref:Uncharacterized protein n=1 Tax=Pseudacidovorax intermedius TaxID=433924 RepID=A0A370F202_9BURK|nr:hypothetical protein DFR41_1217 [Pseudacidovorax intermedius]
MKAQQHSQRAETGGAPSRQRIPAVEVASDCFLRRNTTFGNASGFP